MATQKNFVVKNGLTVGSVEVIDSNGNITSAALGSANTENIQDTVGTMVVGGTNITATYNDGAGTLTLDADLAGDIEGVTAGDGLTGGGASGELTVNVGAGNGITVNADDIEIDTSVVTDLSTAQTLTNKTLTSPVLNTGVSGTAVLDDDTFGTATATTLASSESIKAYVDAQTTSEIAEGSNQYFTNERVDDRVNSLLTAGTGITLTYDDGADTLTIAGAAQYGDSDVESYLSGGTGVTFSSGAISIGQDVATSSNVTFGNLTLSGDLTVNGTTTTIATTNTVASDTLFELGNGTSGTPANDSGIIIERGDQNNAFIGFDESADKFTVGTTTATGASTGDLTITTGTLVANLEGNVTGDVTGNADTATSLETARTIGGVSFDGSANIDLPGVNTTGNQNTSGTAAAWTTARTITLGGDLTGNVSVDGSANATLTATIAANSVALGTDTTGNFVGGISGTTNEIEVSGSGSENATVTIGLPDNVTISGTSTLTGKATTSFTTIGSSDGALRNTFIHSAAPTSGDGAIGDVWITYA